MELYYKVEEKEYKAKYLYKNSRNYFVNSLGSFIIFIESKCIIKRNLINTNKVLGLLGSMSNILALKEARERCLR